MNRGALIRFAVLMLLASAAMAQNALEIITLRNRTAEQVLPALRPLLEPGATLSGQGNQLFVRTSPTNLADLRLALDVLDAPQRRLLISVRFDDARDIASRGLGASGRIGARDSQVEIRAQDARSRSQQRESTASYQRAQTRASGRLGEWFELGSVAMGAARDERGIASATTSGGG